MRYWQQCGASFLEFMMVVITLSIVAAVNMKPPSEYINLTALSSQLVSDIRYAKAKAMSRHQRVEMQFYQQHYSSKDGSLTVSPLAVAKQISLPKGVSLRASHQNVIFDSKGIPYTGSVEYSQPLSTAITLTLMAGSHSKQIRIIPSTGHVEVVR